VLFSVAPELKEQSISPNRSRFELGPLEPGFGYTLGNSLRRTLLSSIPGAAITSIKVAGVLHEFDTVEGVTEDITELILNLKNIVVSVDDAALNEDGYAEMHLRKSGPGAVTAADIQLPAGVEIYNPELHLAQLNDKGTLEVEFVVEQGRGYISAANNKASGGEIGRIPVDSIYSPVLKVTYKVEATRVEQRTDFDKLVLDVETKGSMSPKDAVASAGHTLVELFGLARSMNLEAEGLEMGPTMTEQVNAEQLNLPIENLDLTVRSYNCLKREGIHTVGEVITRSEADLMDIRNFGAKSIDEVKEKLAQLGLALKDSPPGFDPSRYASYDDDEIDEDVEAASDDDQSFAEDEQL
jgi:DNA-directed RNA polymerase subunit alpha